MQIAATAGSEDEMSFGETNLLLDLIYEAAAVPEMWPAVLDSLADMTGSVGTFLITTDPSALRWTSSESVRQLGLDFLEGRWHERNPRMERLLSHRHAGFMREIDMFTAEENGWRCDVHRTSASARLRLGGRKRRAGAKRRHARLQYRTTLRGRPY